NPPTTAHRAVHRHMREPTDKYAAACSPSCATPSTRSPSPPWTWSGTTTSNVNALWTPWSRTDSSTPWTTADTPFPPEQDHVFATTRRTGAPRWGACADLPVRPGPQPYSLLVAADSSTFGVSGTSVGFGTPLKVKVESVPSPSASITTICPGLRSPN